MRLTHTEQVTNKENELPDHFVKNVIEQPYLINMIETFFFCSNEASVKNDLTQRKRILFQKQRWSKLKFILLKNLLNVYNAV